MTTLRWMLVAMLIFAAGCDDETGSEITMGATIEHSNGLSVPVLEGFRARETEDGFMLVEEADVRTPTTVTVRLSTDPPAAASDAAVKTRTLEGATAHFVMRNRGSYSGGTDFELTAWRQVEARWIVVTANDQSERDTPAFAAPWAVLAGATAR